MKTKWISLLLAAAIGAGCGGCAKKDMYAGLNEKAAEYAARSVQLNQSVQDKYWTEDALFMYHYYPNFTTDASGDMSTAFAWPYTETVASSWRIATLGEGFKTYISGFYEKTLQGFEYYRAYRTDYHTYCATRATAAGMAAGDTYYDDNVWISREFLNAYEIFGNEEYLKTSEAVAEYIWSGWAGDELGGIYWCEQKKNSRNACSNAPAALLFARLSETLEKPVWLDRAVQVYQWTYDTLRDPSDNVYWDNISNEGNVTTWKFTYNTGSMIAAGVKLYEITGEQKYLDQASASARGAYNYWFESREGYDFKTITSDNPWFNVLLLDAWVELYKYEPEALEYIEAYEANLNNAYAMLEDGLMPSNWVNGWSKDENGNPVVSKVIVLDSAANAENFGTLAYFYQFVKGENK